MELSSVFVLALVSFVTGTPHGYGVKSGAVAKAEANAGASAFGVLPAIPSNIPSGGGFSGSFSKSSSSSFASSSSSASLSSSSYSFSGIGSNGIAEFGCQSNNCKNGGNSVPTALHNSFDNGVQNNVGALIGTGSTAGSSITSGNGDNLPCTGNNCNGFSTSNNKCSSGECDLANNQQDTSYGLHSSNNYNIGRNCASGLCNQQTGLSQNGYETPKCISGNCSPSPQQQKDKVSNTNYHNEDSADKSQLKLTYEVSDDHTNVNNNNNNGESQSECSQGKCGSYPSPSPTPSSDRQDIFIPLAPSGNGAKPVYPKPTTQLVAPNLGPTCTSHNCNIAPSGPDSSNGKLPTSYNVPILGTNPSSTNSLPDSNSNPTGTFYNLPTGTISLNHCGSAGCSSDISSPINTASVFPKPSTYSHGNYPSQLLIAPAVSPGCAGSNCKPLNTPNSEIPIYPLPSKQPTTCSTPGCSQYPATGSSISGYPSQFDSSKPTYTGAPSLPFGISTPNSKVESNHYPKQSTYPGYESVPVKPNASPGVSQENSINNGGYKINTGSYNLEQQGSIDKKIDEKSQTSFVPTSQNLPTYTGGFIKPTGSVDGNFEYTPSHGPIGTSRPHFDVSSTTQNTPIYTGGFGGPAGSFDTSSGIGTQFALKPSHGQAPAANNLPHTTSIGGVTGSAGGNYASNSNSGLHGISKPSGSLVPPPQNIPTNTGIFVESHGPTTVIQPGLVSLPKPIHEKNKLPQFTGSFGGPMGILKPNQYNLPAKLPTSTSNNYTPTSCTSGSCNAKDVPNVIGVQQDTNQASTALSASAGAKAVAYSGGFGGPSGFLKPFDNNRQSKSEYHGAGAKGQSGVHDYSNDGIDYKNKPDDSLNQANSGAHNNAEIPTNIGPQANTGTQSNAGSQANAGVQANAGAQANAGTQANAGAQANSGTLANTGAQANAAAFASSSAFSANQGIGTTGCKSGCGANYGSGHDHNFASSSSLGIAGGLDDIHNGGAGASASAKSVAGTNSGVLGIGKSFASSSATAHSSAGASVKGGYGR